MTAAPAALLLTGRVMHARHVAPKVRFAYRIWMLALDLDRIDEAAAQVRGLAHNRRAAAALFDRDHGPRDGTPLRPWVAARLAEAGLAAFAHRIHFIAMPRVLGFGFNPIACFLCHDDQGRLGAILHQVKNTFGDQHGYLVPVPPDGGAIRHRAEKRLHVSPFFDRAGGYRFAVRPPDFTRGTGEFALAIHYGTPGEARISAVMRLAAAPLTTAALWRQLAAMPLVTLKVVAAIHWQALHLWLRGARYHPVPAPPDAPVSLGARA